MLQELSLSLKDKVCLITGASGGIGLSTTEVYLKMGAGVMATDLRANKEINALVQMYPNKLEFFAFDLTVPSDMDECLKIANANNVNVLFNNAAIFDMAPLLESSLAMYEKIFDLNVKAMFALMQGIAKNLTQKNLSGSIINLSSQAGRRGEALVSHYCASKAAVISYTQSAALALAKHNIRVNAISPGVIDTPMWKFVDGLFAKYENRPLGEKKRLVGEEVPLGKMGSPLDVAKTALFLASDMSSYITGQTINVDGGNVLS